MRWMTAFRRRSPPSDAAFGTLAQALVSDGLEASPDLEARLRQRYPRARVRPRELSGEEAVVWYVYREGHWVPW
jgi:hypothetical protein